MMNKIEPDVVHRKLKRAVGASTIEWIKKNRIVNEKGKPIKLGVLSDHFFLKPIYQCREKVIVVRKPSQAGVSTWAITTEIHDGRYWGINQIHTLPTVNDVNKFVPSKTNEIIKQNPVIREGMDKKDVDSTAQKQFGKGFVFYKGTKSDSTTLMLTSDRNWYDEYDKSEMKAISDYDSRTEGADSLKEFRYLSTPTVPGYGIDRAFLEGDQRYWRFNCKACGYEQHMEWPENVSMKRRCYICKKCDGKILQEWIRPYHKELNPEGTGHYKARYPGRKAASFSLTQMIFPWVKAGDLIDYYDDAVAGRKERTLEYFYNHKLGYPYVGADSKISKGLILSNLINKEHLETNSCMGVDVQERELYLHIGNEEGIFVIGRIPDDAEYLESEGKIGKSKWDRWAELMEVYDVRYCVIDGGYKPNDSINAAKRFPGRVWVNWYKDDPKKEKIIRWSDDDFKGKQGEEENEYKVLTERDRMIDLVLTMLKKGKPRFFYTATDPAIKMMIEHVETTYARTVTNQLGHASREWVSTGKDDLLHALIYFCIALIRKEKNES